MIEANELRIGNWVLYQGQFKIVRYIQVDRIGAIKKNLQPQTMLLIKCSGIPLTEEILFKCGFFKRNGLYGIQVRINKGNHKLSYFFLDKTLRVSNSYVPCQYLHQLQNIYFALTGQELNIEL